MYPKAPHRGEPNSKGEVNYEYIFEYLETLGYDGWIGLEYKPTGTTLEGLGWIESMGFKI